MAGPNTQEQAPIGATQTFACQNCGGTVEVHAPGNSLSAVCIHCGSVADLSDPNYQVIYQAWERIRYQPVIPLGRRGELEGITWEVIGFVVKQDLKFKWTWQEYLLFNPIYGYRFLVLSDGHWSLVRMTMDKPEVRAGWQYAKVEGDTYKRYHSGDSAVIFVLGEFYWQVKVNEKINFIDFIDPPQMLSLEVEPSGRTWSIGEYVTHAEIKKAFGSDLKLPFKKGIAPNQPNHHKQTLKRVIPLFLLFFAALIGLQVVFTSRSNTEIIVQKEYKTNDAEATYTIPDIKISEGKTNIDIKAYAQISNEWVEIEGNLHNKATGQNYGFRLPIEYYYGVDSDGSWSEGSQTQSMVINLIPGGTYDLSLSVLSGKTIPVEAGAKPQRPDTLFWNIEIKRDVPIASNFFLIFILLGLYPAFLIFASSNFEKVRMSG